MPFLRSSSLLHAMPDINGAVIIKDTPISQQQLAQLPPNVIIEPNYKVQSLLTYPTDDPMILEQWSFATMDMSLWDAVETNNTIVAVIDSGAGVADIGFSFGLNQDGWQPIASYRGDDEAVGLLADFSAVPLSLTVSIVSEEREPEPVIIETATETPTVIVIPTLEAISSTSGEEDPSLTPSVTVTETPTATITPSVTPTHTAEPTATHLPTETPLPTDEPAPVEETQEVDP